MAQGDNAPAQSVSELSGALKRTVEDRFGNVRVRGEISGWKRAASGHCYFTLKDDKACIDSVLWKGSAARLAFAPEDGVEVIASGKLTTYPGRSKYQVVVETLELAGEGALMALLEKRRKALAAEGLFASERKRTLPYLPRVIGVVTSPTGAVIRDILHRLEDRFPTHVIVWPVQVQGERAAAQVAEAIRGFDALAPGGPVPRPDLLIVARGGGSIEDLWGFNEEVVVRAAADCSIPLISAVGHETDTTLIDHAADRRAPTPTAAAEMAVPVLADLRRYVGDLGMRTADRVHERLRDRGDRLRLLAERLPAPARLLETVERRVQDAGRGLPRGLTLRVGEAGARLGAIEGRLTARLLEQPASAMAERLDRAARASVRALQQRSAIEENRLVDRSARARTGLGQRIGIAQERYRPLGRRLDARILDRKLAQDKQALQATWARALMAHPDKPLERGYARVTGAHGDTVPNAAQARREPRMTLHFVDGSLEVIPGGSAGRGRVARKPAPAYSGDRQGDLFGSKGDDEENG